MVCLNKDFWFAIQKTNYTEKCLYYYGLKKSLMGFLSHPQQHRGPHGKQYPHHPRQRHLFPVEYK